jgi:hypothetical protein
MEGYVSRGLVYVPKVASSLAHRAGRCKARLTRGIEPVRIVLAVYHELPANMSGLADFQVQSDGLVHLKLFFVRSQDDCHCRNRREKQHERNYKQSSPVHYKDGRIL